MSEETSAASVYEALLGGNEIALFDVREEAHYATAHPLFAASLPFSRLELEVLDRVPRRDTQVVCYDDGDGLAERAVARLHALGYSGAAALGGGLAAWKREGRELFSDVNVPSKAFGELVDATLHPPSIEATELLERIERGDDLVVLDARRFDEFHTMSIPGALSAPGGELVRRVGEAVRSSDTTVVVNCAGRTRSILGAQSLRNAGIANPVVALRNGTIGWTLAGLELEHGASRRLAPPLHANEHRRVSARQIADRAGVEHIDDAGLARLLGRAGATIYRFDVRDPQDYAASHLAGFRSAPGGQLVQETDYFAPVRGATVVLTDDDGIAADLTSSWLAQMGWTVLVLDADGSGERVEGPWRPTLPELPVVPLVTPTALAREAGRPGLLIIDLESSRGYHAGHLPAAAFALRSELPQRLAGLTSRQRIVLTSPDGVLATFAASDLPADLDVRVLDGGTAEWKRLGLPLEHHNQLWLSRPEDRYQRPYEGTDVDPRRMQDYLDWEYGLVEQLRRDASHHFFVLGSDPTVAVV